MKNISFEICNQLKKTNNLKRIKQIRRKGIFFFKKKEFLTQNEKKKIIGMKK